MGCTCNNGSGATTTQPLLATSADVAQRVVNHLQRSVVPDCPSIPRWGREMAAEYEQVKRAKAAGNPIPRPPKPSPKALWTQDGWRVPEGQREEKPGPFDGLMKARPPHWTGLAWSYLSAKIPFVLGIEADDTIVATRQRRCLRGTVYCSQCSAIAKRNVDRGGFECGTCPDWFLPDDVADRIAAPCEHAQAVKGGLFCGSCRCPKWRDAHLAVKSRMPLAQCPKGWWPGTGWQLKLTPRFFVWCPVIGFAVSFVVSWLMN